MMRELLEEIVRRFRFGEAVALATVVSTFHSAPRPSGASMLVDNAGIAVGSVSGGCVESAVYDAGQAVLGGQPPRVHRFGISDDEALDVGLTCGGTIEIFVERIDDQSFPNLEELKASVHSEEPVAMATVIEHADPALVGTHMLIWPERSSGGLGSARVSEAVLDDARGMLASGRNGVLEYGPEGQRRGTGLRVFVATFEPPPRMLVFGAIDFASAVARLGSFLGYRVTVCDARPVFATRGRFPEADEVVVDWPHRYFAAEVAGGRIDGRTAVMVLTHDPKFDVPLLEQALRQSLEYVGAMGSRRTHADRLRQLRARGLGDRELARLSSPIGLDLGGRTPEETAVSIAAELIALRWGGRGNRLSTVDGPIHRPRPGNDSAS